MIKFFPMAMATVATATLFVGTEVLAQPAPTPVELTRAEAAARATAAFERLDANKDGQLTQADRAAQARQRFNASDTDGNGQLSFAEVSATYEMRREMRADRMTDRMADRGAQRAEGPSGPGTPGMRGPMGRGGPGERGGMAGRMLERADTDNNGSISKDEFTGTALARFDRADANGDGTITADERRGRGGDRRGHRGPDARPRG